MLPEHFGDQRVVGVDIGAGLVAGHDKIAADQGAVQDPQRGYHPWRHFIHRSAIEICPTQVTLRLNKIDQGGPGKRVISQRPLQGIGLTGRRADCQAAQKFGYLERGEPDSRVGFRAGHRVGQCEMQHDIEGLGEGAEGERRPLHVDEPLLCPWELCDRNDGSPLEHMGVPPNFRKGALLKKPRVCALRLLILGSRFHHIQNRRNSKRLPRPGNNDLLESDVLRNQGFYCRGAICSTPSSNLHRSESRISDTVW